MRQLFSIVMSCVFALAFAQAPFAHVHEHSDAYDHGGAFHSHGPHHDDHDEDDLGIEGEDPDHDARSIDVFKIVKSPDSKLLSTLPTSLIGFSLPVTEELVQLVAPQGHDPPDSLSSLARAPPL
jgi:hypothetical protein